MHGMTFLEILVASTILALLAGSITSLLIGVSRQQRLSYIEGRVYQRADALQDNIMSILRAASRNDVVPFSPADAVEGQAADSQYMYRRIIFRKGFNQPNEELRFDPATHQLTYDPDLSKTGDEVRLDAPNDKSKVSRLEDCWFAAGMAPGGIPDSSLILVQLQVSDVGLARNSYRKTADTAVGRANWVVSARSFAVNLRRN